MADLLTDCCLLKGLGNELRLKKDRKVYFWFITLVSFFVSVVITHRGFDNIVLIKVSAEMWEHGNLATV